MTPVSAIEGDLTHLNVTTQYEESSTELDSGVCNALHTGYVKGRVCSLCWILTNCEHTTLITASR